MRKEQVLKIAPDTFVHPGLPRQHLRSLLRGRVQG